MTQPADPGFAADVRRAASVWRGSPGLPLVYLLLGLSYLVLVLAQAPPPDDCVKKTLGSCPTPSDQAAKDTLLNLALLPVLLFQIGLSGTARVWYSRRFAGDTLTAGEIWSMSWRFFWRFVRLGLLLVAVSLPFALTGFVLAYQRNSQIPFLVGIAAGYMTADVLFTFATPGLALYNDRAWRAFTGGLTILRTTWPHCALYALVPPLALLLLAQAAPEVLGKPVAAAFAMASPMLTLLFAGAAVSFVLRRWPPQGRDGSLPPQRFFSPLPPPPY